MTNLIVTEHLVRAEEKRDQLDFLARNGTYSISVFQGEDGGRMFLPEDQMKEFLEASLRILKANEQPT